MTTTETTAPSSPWIGRRVDQRGDAAPVGDREHDLLGAHRLAAAQRRRQRQLVQRDLAPVGAPERHHLQELLRGAARAAQAVDDPPRLAVERDRGAAPRIEHHDADRGGLDQRLEVGPRALLGAVRAGVGDRARRLRGEQPQHLLVLVGERLPALLLDEIEVADMHVAMVHRHALEGAPRQAVRVETERAHIRGGVRQPQRARQVAEVLEQPRPVGPLRKEPVPLVGKTGGDEVAGLPGLVDGRDGAVACVGQPAGALQDPAQHGLEVEARGDVADRLAEPRDALAQGLDLALRFVELAQWSTPSPGPPSGAGPPRPAPCPARAGRGIGAIL